MKPARTGNCVFGGAFQKVLFLSLHDKFARSGIEWKSSSVCSSHLCLSLKGVVLLYESLGSAGVASEVGIGDQEHPPPLSQPRVYLCTNIVR